jgi:hypothetical protein
MVVNTQNLFQRKDTAGKRPGRTGRDLQPVFYTPRPGKRKGDHFLLKWMTMMPDATQDNAPMILLEMGSPRMTPLKRTPATGMTKINA